jgi:hypothetical protein
VPGVGALSAIALLLRAPADAYVADPALVRPALGRRNERVEQAFADGSAREIIDRNRLLMDLRRPAPCWDELDALTTRGSWDEAALRAWLVEQNLSSVDQPALIARLETLATHAA